ncbi:MAG: TolC family protein [Fibromonadaceae bacterium]|nr:TolC family protein [Fibromonadaceae bacterium]
MNNYISVSKPLSSLLCLLLLGLAGFAAAGTPLSLKTALEEGVKGNLDIQRSELGSDGIDAQVDVAFRKYLPQLTVNGNVTRLWMDPAKVPNYEAWIASMAGAGPLNPNNAFMEVPINWNMTGDIKVSQLLYAPQALTGIKMAKKGKEIDALGRQELKEGIIYGISMQYWSIVYMEENLAVLTKSRDNLVEMLKIVEAMMKQGLAKKSDLNATLMSIADVNTQVDNLKTLIEGKKDALLQIMGRTIGTEIDLTDRLSTGGGLDSIDRDSLYNRDITSKKVEQFFAERSAETQEIMHGDPLSGSITLKRMEQQIKLQEMQIDLTKEKIYPNIVAFASYGTDAKREKFDFYSSPQDKFKDNGTVGINVTIPVFDGMSNSAERSYARIQKRQIEIDMEKQKTTLQATYKDAKSTLLNAQRLVVRNWAVVKISEDNYFMKEAEYKEQIATITDLLKADSDMQRAYSNLFNALLSEKTAELALEQVLGLLHRRVQ